ncbi:MAG TPA: HTTM domain-containing protein, partial [Coleofasciculaceae cyanobacterium]
FMAVNQETTKSKFALKLEEIFGLDLRSLAVFRIGLALIVIADLIGRAKALTAHYTDYGILPRSLLIDELLQPWYWSIHLFSGQPLVQWLLFLVAFFFAIAMLVGYRTRLATIATWAFVISVQNRNPALIFAADDVLRAILFWAMFLPLGACYSIDSALNLSTKPLPKRIVSGATFALLIQICYVYIWSAAYKTQSPLWWPDGDAVYYSLSFDQYATGFGEFLLSFPIPLLRLLTLVTLVFEWVGPLIIFIPFRTSFFRCVAIISFTLLHFTFGLTFELGIFPFLSIFSWLALTPSFVWDAFAQRIATPQRGGLTIYYDAECGFCKKVVYLLRTFLILPKTPLLLAQDDPSIFADLQEKNSWVVVDWQGNRHFKWEGLSYVFSLSPIFGILAYIMRWKPMMSAGTKFYETIASNRKVAGKFTAPLKFHSSEIRSSSILNIATLLLLVYATIWNLKGFVQLTSQRGLLKSNILKSSQRVFKSKTLNSLEWIGGLTRLDQSWSIFAPAPPRDDGWPVIQGKLQDSSDVDVIRGKGSVSWEKPTIKERKAFYKNQQWRVYYINFNRAIGKKLYPSYGQYLCNQWNSKHRGGKQLDSLEIYFMDERTVPPGESQGIEKKSLWKQSCSKKPR